MFQHGITYKITIMGGNMVLKEAVLYKKLPDGTVECQSCLRRCSIFPNGTGFCKTRKNHNGKLFSSYYGYFSGIQAEPLGSKPFLHFKDPKTGMLYPPEEPTLSIGGYGCNFQCKGCQNAVVSRIPSNIEDIAIKRTPEQIVDLALQKRIRIIAFTWNEPAIMPEIVLETAKLAQENDLRTVFVSNGSPTKEYLDLIGPYLDAFRYDIKARPTYGDAFYRMYCNFLLPVAQILENIRYTKKTLKKHVELLTVVVRNSGSDCPSAMTEIARWIHENLGPETPWHIARFFPAHELSDPKYGMPPARIDALVEYVKNYVNLSNLYAVKDKGCDCLKQKQGPDETGCKNGCCCK